MRCGESVKESVGPAAPSAVSSSKPSFVGTSASSVAVVVVGATKDEKEEDDIILLLIILARASGQIGKFLVI